ncbi:MAG: glycoside hydrolase family 16 protein [Bacteroidales bacterium]
MKTHLCLLFLMAGSLNLTFARDHHQSESDSKWKLVWKDEFKKKKLNGSKWSKIPRGKSDWNNYMSDDPALYEIKDGNLILRGIVNPDRAKDTAQYLTGGVYTKDKYAVEHGRVEIRARLDNAQGCWPALWMLPEGKVKWPDGGEIDIMEHLNFDDFVYQTVHSHYTYVLKETKNPPNHATAPIDKSGYNVFAVEKYADRLVFFVNDKKTFEYKKIDTDLQGQFPFDTPYYILMDMQLGGNWVGSVNPSQLPVEMHIDWIRVYEKK